jgi:hypothetical protein
MKLILQSLTLFTSFIVIFILEQTGLSSFIVQVLAGLIIAYILITFSRRKKHPHETFGGSLDIFILNTAIFLLIYLTNAIISPLFFLLYFLGFGITFIFEPATVFIFAICTIFIFLPQTLKNGSLESFIKLGSLLLISPLAFFFGQEYKDQDKEIAKRESLQERTQEAANNISQNVHEVINEEKKNLKQKDMEKLNNILEETDDLREEIKE